MQILKIFIKIKNKNFLGLFSPTTKFNNLGLNKHSLYIYIYIYENQLEDNEISNSCFFFLISLLN